VSNTTWNQNLLRALRGYLPWPNFAECIVKPFLRLDPLMNDEDCEFHGDMLYARALLDETLDECIRTSGRARPLPSALSSTLDLALALVRDDVAWADDAGAAIAEWRGETAMRRAAA